MGKPRVVVLRNLSEALKDILVIGIHRWLEKAKDFMSFITLDLYHNPLPCACACVCVCVCVRERVCVVDVHVPVLEMRNWHIAG